MPVDATPLTPPPEPVAPGASTLAFPVVGIGASAGGIKALLTFFEHMPTGAGIAFVVVVHLSPKHESNLDHVLQSATTMPVIQVSGAVRIERDHVYVIPPGRSLVMRDGVLELGAPVSQNGQSAAIDVFLRTLAHAHADHAIGIVMSGTGSDGALGVRSIKEQGGVALAQLPEDAEHASMPRSAIQTGSVDFVLGAAEMPQRVLQLWQTMQRVRVRGHGPSSREARAPEAEADALHNVLEIMRARTGHDFGEYKRATVVRRVERRLQINQIHDLTTYADFLHQHPAETASLLKDLLISVTNFFRDAEAFESLEKSVIPKLFEGRRSGEEIRVWVPGCATGEEAYSIALLLAERAEERAVAAPPIQMFATDIDEDALASARAGFYPDGIVADVSPSRLRRFFTREVGGYRIQKSIREMIMFSKHDLLRDPPFSRLDLVSCRNVLIYLQRGLQARVLDSFNFALRMPGYLFLGSSESVDDRGDVFTVVDKPHRIFQSRGRAHGRPTSAPSTAAWRGGPRVQARDDGPGNRRSSGFGELHHGLLEAYAPPSVLVNEQHDILHLSQHAGEYLQFGAGDPSLNLIQALQPEMRGEVRAALFHAARTLEDTRVRISVPGNDAPRQLVVTVHPVRDAATGRVLAVVMFDERSGEPAAPAAAPPAERTSLADQLEAELARAKEELLNTVEQYETQAEEHKASNEELQAMNEELRSASEELETSKEELQSMNEELDTVNQELRIKVEEVTKVNNDLQNFSASTDIAVIFVDRAFRLMRFTPQATRLFNVIEKDIGRDLFDISHKLDYPELRGDLETLLERLQASEREVRSRDGAWYLVRVMPYRALDDRIGGAVLTFVDVSDRKDDEVRLRRAELLRKRLVESAHDYAIITTDTSGRITSWNPGAENVFGFTEREAVGESGEIIFTPEDRAAGVPEDEMRRARETGRAEDERWHLRKGGEQIFVSGVMAPLADGALFGYVKIARDATGQQQAAAEREHLLGSERTMRSAVEDLNRQKDQFLAMLSHELRNPLNLILMQAQLLLRDDVFKDAKRRHTAEVIYQTAATQARLVDDLLDVSRVMTGKLAVQQQAVPLSYIVGDSIGAASRDAEQKEISVELDLTPEPLIVQADPVRVRQIAWNLLSNAIKFTPPGGHVYVTLKREGDEARLDVVDTGQGIQPAQLPGLFEMFRQGEPDLASRQGGLGIGLALVRHLVDLHGGRIEAFSEGQGKGSRFSVWLPVYTVPTPEAQDFDTARIAAAQPPPYDGRANRLAGIRALIVDDSSDAASALEELLQMEGATVRSATSGQAALDLASRERFDVVVSDLAMPAMDGLTLVRALRETPLNRRTPAIACTGFNRPKDVERARKAGFDAHLGKPIGIADLIETILRVVKKPGA